MLARSYLKMARLDLNLLKPNSIALPLMSMVFVIQEAPMEGFMFGTKSKS
jgi:hypothetical protein